MPKAEVPHKDEPGEWEMKHEQTDVDKQKVTSASLSVPAPSLLFGLPEWLQLILGGLLTGVLCHSNSMAILLRKSLTGTAEWGFSILESEIGSLCEAFSSRMLYPYDVTGSCLMPRTLLIPMDRDIQFF